MTDSKQLVNKLWNYCDILRDDGLSYEDYVEQLNIRINHADLESLKQKASRLGIKYQTFISEVLHRLAQS